MGTSLYILLGVAAGVLAATPMLYVLRKTMQSETQLDAGHAIACGVVPFMGLQLALLAVALLRPEALLGFGVAASLAFLAVVTVAGLVAWRRMG